MNPEVPIRRSEFPPLSTLVRLDLQASHRVRAGQLAARFDTGGLRYLKLGEREVIRRIYAAVRDRNWGTVPFEISDLDADVGRDHFQIRFTSTHRQNEIHFVWRAEIVGSSESSIRFTFAGEAKSTFFRNRIGFCVLHPIRECAGARCVACHAGGAQSELRFPELVAAAQPVSGFHDLTGLAHEVDPGAWLEVKFAGDAFEMEDQRNWIDASYKTFCTPLRIPYPVEIKAGTRVTQEVSLRLVDRRAQSSAALPARKDHSTSSSGNAVIEDRPSRPPIPISLSKVRRQLPAIGLSAAACGQPLTALEIEKLSCLKLGHLRCDAKLASRHWPESLRLGWNEAVALGVPLELAVHLPQSEGESELNELGAQLRGSKIRVIRILLFRDGEKTVSLASFRLARPYLTFLEAPIGAGTDADFYQLNQVRPPHAEADFVNWSMNPQVHAFDLASLAETPAAIPSQLTSAFAFFPGKPAVISPITLKPRFNPVASAPELPGPPGELPGPVDPRQLSPFAAAWTLAVLKHLAEMGAHSVTLFETTGWRGVMERMAGSLLPERFPSHPGQVFPLFYAIAAASRSVGGEVRTSHSGDPLRVESLALQRNGMDCLWLANLTDLPQKALVSGLGRVQAHRRIPWEMPEVWRFQPLSVLDGRVVKGEELAGSGWEVTLEPYGLHCLESQAIE